MVQKCLLFIAYSKPKLTIVELVQAVSTPNVVGAKLDKSNTITEREIMRRCSSLIRKSENGKYLEFAHFSVQEFLENKTALLKSASKTSLEAYFVSRDIGERTIAAQCLRFVQLKNFDEFPASEEHAAALCVSREEHFPFYHKAALMWLKSTNDIFEDDDADNANILELMKFLFHPRKTSHFTNWALTVLTKYLEIVRNFFQERQEESLSLAWTTIIEDTFSPFHFAAALNIPELCNHFLKSVAASCAQLRLFRAFEFAVMSIIGLSISKYAPLVPEFVPAGFKVVYVPSTSRRNSTINTFSQKDIRLSGYAPLPNGLSIFSTSLIAVTYFLDWTATVKLLLAGEIPGVADFGVLDQCLKHISGHLRSIVYLPPIFRESTLKLLLCLNDNINIESEWGYRMCSKMWSWALEKDIVLSKSDAPWLDSRITMSRHALHIKACRAIYDGDGYRDINTELKQCLEDPRLDLEHQYKEHDGGTLLHIAVYESAKSSVEMLLDAGCDPNCVDEKGLHPLHHINYRRHQALEILKVFSIKGISLLSTETNGCTIWHRWTQQGEDSIGFLGNLYSLDCKTSETALKAKDHDGHTPLILLFKTIADWRFADERFDDEYVNQDWAEEFRPDDQLHKALQVIQLSHKLQGFWDSHPGIFGRAARTGSFELVQALLEADAPLDPGEAGAYTPLHQLGPRASVECLELLLSLYPAAPNTRLQGSLPIELYLQRALDDCIDPEPATLKCFIKSTQLWSRIIALPITIQLTKRAIETQGYEFIYVLLNHGLDVHQRVDGVSLIEYVCSRPKARQLACTSQGRTLMSEFFNHTRNEELNHSAVAGPGKGLTLLLALLCNHRDCNCNGECSGGIPWLIRNLVSRGVSLNSQCREAAGWTPLCYYLARGYDQYAELLLDLGADSTIAASASGWGPAQFAVRANKFGFLKKLWDTANENDIRMSWETTYPFYTDRRHHPNGTWFFKDTNNIHLASSCRSVECLELVLNKKLITNVNAKSAECYTPLHFAAMGDRGDHLAVMRILLSEGADLSAKGGDGNTPLHFAAWNGNLSAIKLLLDHGAMESFNLYRKTPKCYALQQGHNSIVQLLQSTRSPGAALCSGINLELTLEKRERFLAMAFETAIVADDLATCKSLVLEGCPIDVKMPRNKGISPLTAALLFQRKQIWEWLLNNGASILRSQVDRSRQSTMEIAAATLTSSSIFPLLLTRYVSEGGDLLRGDDYPTHEAVRANNIQGLAYLLKGIIVLGKTISYVVKLIIYFIILCSILTFQF